MDEDRLNFWFLLALALSAACVIALLVGLSVVAVAIGLAAAMAWNKFVDLPTPRSRSAGKSTVRKRATPEPRREPRRLDERTVLIQRLAADLQKIEVFRRIADVDLDAMPEGPVPDYSVRRSTKQVIWLRDEGRCTQCGSNKGVRVIKFKSGTASIDNLRVSCLDCAER